VMAKDTMFTCSDTSLSEIRESIAKHRLNRVVVASCTPRTHEPLFRDTLREAGLNQYLFELANIRDQCSWVHSKTPDAATDKATELVRMALARSRRLQPLNDSKIPVTGSALVIGGGLSGMTASLALADQGFPVHLVERTGALGGNLSTLTRTLERDDVAAFTAGLIARVSKHPNITVHLNTEVASVSGHVGEFHVPVEENGRQSTIGCGAIIVATGAGRAKPKGFLYGESGTVMTQNELEGSLARGDMPGGNVVMIQCVGSRNDEHQFCSRICCSMAVKNALRIKERSPQTQVFVLYRDIRTYGFREAYYTKARKAGVVFIRYDRDLPPEVTASDLVRVRVESPDFPETVEIEAGTVVLGTGIEPGNNAPLANMLKVPLNSDGFFVEAHMKLRPVDFASEGIFLCGLAHSPKMMDENISQAKAAAARVAGILSKTTLDVGAQVSWVDQDKCISCMTCVNVCPFTAPFMNEDHKGQIEAVKCMGCGICASECPARAITVHHSRREQFTAMIEGLLEEEAGR
jgi:heterodisulfide reductase subunit A2